MNGDPTPSPAPAAAPKPIPGAIRMTPLRWLLVFAAGAAIGVPMALGVQSTGGVHISGRSGPQTYHEACSQGWDDAQAAGTLAPQVTRDDYMSSCVETAKATAGR